MRRVHSGLPAHLAFVPVDFKTDRLHEVLHGARFDSRTPAFFSCQGTTYYLTRPAIRGTLDAIATPAAPGSLLVLAHVYQVEGRFCPFGRYFEVCVPATC